MSVYVRYPCPGCPQSLSLRLEYVNRWVVCNYCKHRFLSRAKIRVPEMATPELLSLIEEANRAQGFGEKPTEPPPLELVVVGNPSLVGLPGAEEAPQLALRVAELERALARAEARYSRQLEQAQENWNGIRRALEHHTDQWAIRYNQQLDKERAWHARRRERIRAERDAAQTRVRELEGERDRLMAQRRIAAVELARLGARVVVLEQTLEVFQARDSDGWSGPHAGDQLGAEPAGVETSRFETRAEARLEPGPTGTPELLEAAQPVSVQAEEASGTGGTAFELDAGIKLGANSDALPPTMPDGPKAPDSSEDRVAALRGYLRKVHEAEEERVKRRLFRRLTRGGTPQPSRPGGREETPGGLV